MLKKSFVIALLLMLTASMTYANDNVQTFLAGGKLRSVEPLKVDHYLEYLSTMPRPVIKDNLPAYFNWRDYEGEDWMSPVRDQGSCGSCWTFGALAAMEGAINIALDEPDFDIDLSEQFMVSCGAGSCANGGMAEEVLAQLESMGIPDEACYEYLAEEGNCDDACPDWQDRAVKICDWNILVAPSEEELKSELLNGPMPVTMRVEKAPSGASFYSYSGGVWEGSYESCGFFEDTVNHVVALVGWDDSNDTWIVKNSWGDDWGDNGYFYVKRGTSCVGTFSANWLKVDIPTVPDVDVEVKFCADATDFDIEVYPGTNPAPLTFNLENCGNIAAPWKYDYQNIQILDWFSVTPIKGTLKPDETVQIKININSDDKRGDFSADLKFDSLMTGQGFTLPVSVELTTSAPVDGDETVDGDTVSDGDETPDGDQAVDGDEVIDGDAVVDGDQAVDGDEVIDGDTVVDGDQAVDGDEAIDGDTVTDGDQAVDGDEVSGSGSNCNTTTGLNFVMFLMLGLLFAIRKYSKREGEK